MPHNPLGPVCAAATAHLCTAINNFTAQEQQHTLTYPRDLFTAQLRLEKDHLLVPDTPGLGIAFNEEAAPDYGFEYWECPHWHRRDGAYTNW